MQTKQNRPLILTLRLDTDSEAFFDEQRSRYFPPGLNFLRAHLTLFHQLPDEIATYEKLGLLNKQPFSLAVTGLINLGAGVAYAVKSVELQVLDDSLKTIFNTQLIPQDLQGYRPHVTIQNKVTPAIAKALIQKLNPGFSAFEIQGLGLDLWCYLGGPWQHERFYPFKIAEGF